MPIGILCGNCGQQYQAPDSLAGKRVRCRQCGLTISVPGAVSLPPASMLPPSTMLPPPTAVPNWQWGGAPGAGARKNTQPLLIISMLVSLAWASYVCYESLSGIDGLAVRLDHSRGMGMLTSLLLLLLRIGQLLCAVAAVVGMGGMLARQSWSAPVGVISTAAYFGIAWFSTPLSDLSLGIGLGMMDRPFLRTSQMLLEAGLDILVHLIIPAAGLLLFAQYDPLTKRRRDWPSLRLLIGAGCLGWSLYATLNSWHIVDAMLTMLDMAEKFNTTNRVGGSFWGMLILRIGCLLAAVALIAAAGGILLRQDWSIATCLTGAGAYLALTVIIFIWAMVQQGDRGGGLNALEFIFQLGKELVMPACALGWSLWAQNADW